jgi:hypothetical protein
MTTDAPKNVTHLLVGDLSRTACRIPGAANLNTTTIADNATCRECLLNSGRA